MTTEYHSSLGDFKITKTVTLTSKTTGKQLTFPAKHLSSVLKTLSFIEEENN